MPTLTRQPRVPPPQDYLPSDYRGRALKQPLGRSLLLLALCGAVIASVVLFINWRKARFDVVVSPLPSVSVRECTSILNRENGGGAWAKPCADHLAGQQWLRTRLTNVGHSSGYVACSVRAFSVAGKLLFFGGVPPTPNGAMAARVEAGETVTWDYSLPASVKAPVARYEGRCVATPNLVI